MRFFGLQGVVAVWSAAGVALLVAVLGRWGARRWRWGLPTVCAAASLAGWALLGLGQWGEVVWPRSVLEHVLLPAVVIVCGGWVGERVRTRWLGVGCAVFAAWWLAGSGVAQPEFWRVMFGALGVVGVLHWGRAFEAPRGLAVALAMLGGMMLGAVGWLWFGMALVLVVAELGMIGAGLRVVSPVLLMLGLVAGELGAGQMVRGGVDVVDIALIGALGTPFAVVWGERTAGRRFKRFSGIVRPVLAAIGVDAVAWVAYRVLRSY